ncbi:hypothetical protein ACH5RR_021265 [Cinchona calisaya]|uniref:RNase H type-1 domain-containing protein n=1 Tax=Cinchona calisaya TaxID=153742 RepID=A0ABD2ZGT1_9GENT
MEMAHQMGARTLKVHSDSQLVVNQNLGNCEARGVILKRYLTEVKNWIGKFKKVDIVKIARTRNTHADALSKLASAIYSHLKKEILVELRECRSVDFSKKVSCVQTDLGWMEPLINYLNNEMLPEILLRLERSNIEPSSMPSLTESCIKKYTYAPY